MASSVTHSLKALALVVLGLGAAAFAAALAHAIRAGSPLFAQASDVPSSVRSSPSSATSANVERARQLVRAAAHEQNLPGVSVAVGGGGRLLWAEGFGWRDVETRTPMTPDTRFTIGTAASTITPAAAESVGLSHTGVEAAAEWSPEHIGEPEEDFPPSRSSARPSFSRLVWLRRSIHCPTTARRSTSRDPTTMIPAMDDD